VVLVIAVVGGVAYYLLAGAGKTYAVPLVNGEPVATAQAQIKAQHLRSTVVSRIPAASRRTRSSTPTLPKGTTYRRTPW
jgi:hypothetical protein